MAFDSSLSFLSFIRFTYKECNLILKSTDLAVYLKMFIDLGYDIDYLYYDTEKTAEYGEGDLFSLFSLYRGKLMVEPLRTEKGEYKQMSNDVPCFVVESDFNPVQYKMIDKGEDYGVYYVDFKI